MLIRNSRWEEIRNNFSEEEKEEFRKAVIGESICPRGNIINVSLLSIELRNKLGQVMLGSINNDKI